MSAVSNSLPCLPAPAADDVRGDAGWLRLLGTEVIGAVAALTKERVGGPWPGWHPADRRGERVYRPVLYGADHHHAHAELCLLLEGRCRFGLAGRGAALAPGDLVVCPAGVAHGEAFWHRRESYRLAWWSLSREDPALHVTRYRAGAGFALEHRIGLTTLAAAPRQRLDGLRRWAAAAKPPEVETLREALLTVALALYRVVLAGGAERLDARGRLVRRALEVVRRAGGRSLSLDAVAREVQVSPNYLTGLVRSVTGRSLGRLILEERMGAAEQLLRDPALSIKEIAEQLAFSDSYTFSRAFKSHSGQAPTVWRSTRLA